MAHLEARQAQHSAGTQRRRNRMKDRMIPSIGQAQGGMVDQLTTRFISEGDAQYQGFPVDAGGLRCGQDASYVVAGMGAYATGAKIVIAEVQITDHRTVGERSEFGRTPDAGANDRRRTR